MKKLARVVVMVAVEEDDLMRLAPPGARPLEEVIEAIYGLIAEDSTDLVDVYLEVAENADVVAAIQPGSQN